MKTTSNFLIVVVFIAASFLDGSESLSEIPRSMSSAPTSSNRKVRAINLSLKQKQGEKVRFGEKEKMGNTKISPEERRLRVLREMKRPSWGDKEDNYGFRNARASKYRALFIKKETRKRFDENVDGASLKHSIRSMKTKRSKGLEPSPENDDDGCESDDSPLGNSFESTKVPKNRILKRNKGIEPEPVNDDDGENESKVVHGDNDGDGDYDSTKARKNDMLARALKKTKREDDGDKSKEFWESSKEWCSPHARA